MSVKRDKRFELIALSKQGAIYHAVLYNRLGGYYKDQCFWYYNKKEVLWKLRNEYDCIVRRNFK